MEKKMTYLEKLQRENDESVRSLMEYCMLNPSAANDIAVSMMLDVVKVTTMMLVLSETINKDNKGNRLKQLEQSLAVFTEMFNTELADADKPGSTMENMIKAYLALRKVMDRN